MEIYLQHLSCLFQWLINSYPKLNLYSWKKRAFSKNQNTDKYKPPNQTRQLRPSLQMIPNGHCISRWGLLSVPGDLLKQRSLKRSYHANYCRTTKRTKTTLLDACAIVLEYGTVNPIRWTPEVQIAMTAPTVIILVFARYSITRCSSLTGLSDGKATLLS